MTGNSNIPPLPELHITQEQLDAIAGGGCTPEEISTLLGTLKENYEQLVEFTSYVIERVAG